MNIKTVWRKVRWLKAIGFAFLSLVFIALCVAVIVAPEKRVPDNVIKIDNCTVQDEFSIGKKEKTLNVYRFSVENKNYIGGELVLSAILKQDGEFEEINLSTASKSHIQYYELFGPSKGFGHIYFRFYDKNIYYFESLNLTMMRKIC